MPLLAAATALLRIPTADAGPALTPGDFADLARRCAPFVAAQTLAAIAAVESSFDPLAIHDNTTGKSWTAGSADEAVAIARRLIAAGHSVDAGLMQVNSTNFRRLALTVEAAFDPCRSIEAGAQILAEDYAGGAGPDAQQAALRAAISRYNSGDAARGFTNGYVGRVERAARRFVPALDPAMPPASNVSKPPPPSWQVWPDASDDGRDSPVLAYPPAKETP